METMCEQAFWVGGQNWQNVEGREKLRGIRNFVETPLKSIGEEAPHPNTLGSTAASLKSRPTKTNLMWYHS